MPNRETNPPGLSVAGLRHSYGETAVLRLDDWTLPSGAHCLVRGPSGSGKSTLLHVLAGLIAPTGGTVTVAGTRVSGLSQTARDRFRARHIGLVPQKLHLIPALSVLDNLRLARRLAGKPGDDDALRALLARLDLDGLAGRRPASLSQGQAQRAAIARALVNAP